MKRKKGFTLAEILIILTMVGILATLTIPAITNNIQNIQFKTAWKKKYSEYSQVTNKLLFDNGGSFVGIFRATHDPDSDIVYKYCNYMNCVKMCWDWTPGCWSSTTYLHTVVMNDGTLAAFDPLSTDCQFSSWTDIPLCGRIFIDVNGFKNPNIDGIDIFTIEMYQNNLFKPGGASGTIFGGNTCTTENPNLACSIKYLMQ